MKFGKTRVKNEAHEQIRSIKMLYTHPRFDHPTFDSDLALVELDKPVIITDYVIPICLPYDDSDFKLLKPGEEAMIAGWGSKDKKREDKLKTTKRLREVKIPLVEHRRCNSAMSHPLTANMFCAGKIKLLLPT